MVAPAQWGFFENPTHHFDFSYDALVFHSSVTFWLLYDTAIKFLASMSQPFGDIVSCNFNCTKDIPPPPSIPEGMVEVCFSRFHEGPGNYLNNRSCFIPIEAPMRSYTGPDLDNLPARSYALAKFVQMKIEGHFQNIDTIQFVPLDRIGLTISSVILAPLDNCSRDRSVIDFILAHEAAHLDKRTYFLDTLNGYLQTVETVAFLVLFFVLVPALVTAPLLSVFAVIPLCIWQLRLYVSRKLELLVDSIAFEYLGSAEGAMRYFSHKHIQGLPSSNASIDDYNPYSFVQTFLSFTRTHPSDLQRYHQARNFQNTPEPLDGDASRAWPHIFGNKTESGQNIQAERDRYHDYYNNYWNTP